MSLTERQLSFQVPDHANDCARAIAAMIAELSLRECAFLDALWIKRNPTRVIARIKRQHKQFLSELLSYYCCACESFFGAREGQVDWFMNLVADEVAHLATDDGFIMRQPLFEGDRIANRRLRYARRIAARRSEVQVVPQELSRDFLTARTALDLRQLMAGPSADFRELSLVENQLARRLDWTARELIGEED